MDATSLLPEHDAESLVITKTKQPKEPEPFVNQGYFYWVVYCFLLGCACIAGDVLMPTYAVGTGRLGFESDALNLYFNVYVGPYGVWSLTNFVSFSNLPCTPNTTLYEAWGLPSGQCTNTIPSSYKGYVPVVGFWAYSVIFWCVSARCVTRKVSRWWLFLSFIMQGLSWQALFRICDERAAWVDSLNQRPLQVPYQTLQGDIGLAHAEAFKFADFLLTLVTIINGVAFVLVWASGIVLR